MRYHEFKAMNTDILLAAEGTLENTTAGFKQAQTFIAESERRFTRFSDDSELASLNRSAGSWFSASMDLFAVMQEAVRLYRQTEGLFDPAVLHALEQAGYDRSMDEIRANGQAVLLTAQMTPSWGGALPWQDRSPFAGVRLEKDGRRVFLPDGLRIDLGGIAKGWIAEQAALRLARLSTACAVDAGGDAFLIGLPKGETHWRITLEDPCEAGRGMAVLKLRPGAVATSTITKRRWQQGDQAQHHLIDPRTLRPAETDFLSVTAVAAHAVDAEAFAKSLLIAGSFEARRVAARTDPLEFIAVDQNKKMWGSSRSRELLDV